LADAAVWSGGAPESHQRLSPLGFEGPYSGGKHQFMVRDEVTVRIPNPHQGGVSVSLLARLLKQAGVSREEWESV